jgi:hypothetical protein
MDDDVQIGPVLDDVTRWALWSYQLGLQTGFMPIDLHDSVVRAALGVGPH